MPRKITKSVKCVMKWFMPVARRGWHGVAPLEQEDASCLPPGEYVSNFLMRFFIVFSQDNSSGRKIVYWGL